jgi:hypothetical protein
MRFDLWMMRTYPHIPFERYADKTIGHCKAQRGAARHRPFMLHIYAALARAAPDRRTHQGHAAGR